VNSYGLVAVKAARQLVGSQTTDAEWAWQKAAREAFPAGSSSIDKGCPRGAFLGLCKRGAIVGVRACFELSDTKNGDYACLAWKALKEQPQLADDRRSLWACVHADATNENGQLDVVLALWGAGLLVGAPRRDAPEAS
jgi:hypothetical protein